jgi:hypothetical protein
MYDTLSNLLSDTSLYLLTDSIKLVTIVLDIDILLLTTILSWAPLVILLSSKFIKTTT